MSDIRVWIDEITEEEKSSCCCCGRDMFEAEGILNSEHGEIAYYAYQWTDGHQSRFKLGICALNENSEITPGLAAVSCHFNGESLIYSILEPEDSPWGDSEALGAVLSRKDVLEEKKIPNIFSIVDAIAANDKRISSKILLEAKDA